MTSTFIEPYNVPPCSSRFCLKSEVIEYSELFEGDESELALPAFDTTHSRPAAIACIQAKYAKDVLHLPMRTSQMSETFRKLFTSAYIDYGMAHILEFGRAPLQWSKKVAIDDKYVTTSLGFCIPFQTTVKSCHRLGLDYVSSSLDLQVFAKSCRHHFPQRFGAHYPLHHKSYMCMWSSWRRRIQCLRWIGLFKFLKCPGIA